MAPTYRRSCIVLLTLSLTAGFGLAAIQPATAAPTPAPLYATGADEVPGRYIVVLKRPGQGGPSAGVADALAGPLATAREAGGTVRRQYTAALRGFSADLPATAVDRLRRDPAVAYVQTVRIHQQPTGEGDAAAGTQPNAPWDLDRIDQRDLPLNNTYSYPDDAAGVSVYVLDSGIRASHTEFEGRAVGVYSSISGGTADCHNHGTFVASHVAGKTYGVAKKANIKAVRVLDCGARGTTEQIVDGMNWVANNAPKPSVATISIQTDNGVTDQALDDAAKGMIDKGIILVTIAGNFGKGDCNNSPKDPRAINMANSNRDDQRWTGEFPSSYGSCVTAFAPAALVTGATKDSDTSTVSNWKGTSFAAPKAAGHVALQLQKNPNLTMAQAKQNLIDTSTKDKLSNIGSGSPNRLLFVGGTGTPSPSPAVTNPGTQTSTVGTAASLQIQASDPQGDTLTYAASGLPAGLSINASSGLVSGTPTTAGTSNVTVTATDPGGNSGSAAFTWTVNPVGGGCAPTQVVGNSGFENGTAPWTGDTWTINTFPEQPAYRGTRASWLVGYGYARTERISQSIAIPAGCAATLSFYLHIDTAESGAAARDTMTVKLGTATLATYSNLNAAAGYAVRTIDVSAHAGKTLALTFTGVENQSRQTSFVIDDVTVTSS